MTKQQTVNLLGLLESMAQQFGARLEGPSLELGEETTLENFLHLGQGVIAPITIVERYMPWWIGRFVNFGETHFGDEYHQFYDHLVTLFTPTKINQCSQADMKIPPESRRIQQLSFSHHLKVLRLPPETQAKTLDHAIANGLRSNELQAYVSGKYPTAHKSGRPKIIKLKWEQWLDQYCRTNDYGLNEGDEQRGLTYLAPRLVSIMKDAFEGGLDGIPG